MRKTVFVSTGLGGKEVVGIHRNTLEILKCIDSLVDPGEMELLISVSEEDTFHFRNIRVVKAGRSFEWLVRFLKRRGRSGITAVRIERYLYRNYYAKKYVRKERAVSVDTLLLLPRWGCDVTMIYDTIPELFEEEFKALEPMHYWLGVRRRKRAFKKAKLILTDSECAKRDIERLYGKSKPIEVIPCSWEHFLRVEEDDSILEQLKLEPKNYFFSLGSRLPHKNIKWVSCAARKNPQYKFVISGSAPRVKQIDYEGERGENMIFTGYLSDAQVKSLMKNCKAFIQPSLYEGFGIPPMEAMSVGADCIVSDRASLPEVYGNSVWYINPEDYENINLDGIMAGEKESNDVVLNKYSWAKSAELMLKVIKDRFQTE